MFRSEHKKKTRQSTFAVESLDDRVVPSALVPTPPTPSPAPSPVDAAMIVAPTGTLIELTMSSRRAPDHLDRVMVRCAAHMEVVLRSAASRAEAQVLRLAVSTDPSSQVSVAPQSLLASNRLGAGGQREFPVEPAHQHHPATIRNVRGVRSASGRTARRSGWRA